MREKIRNLIRVKTHAERDREERAQSNVGDIINGISGKETSKKLTEDERDYQIKKVADEWDLIFNAISDPISIQSVDNKIIKVNNSYAKMFKMKPEELIGKKCFEIVHKTTKPCENCPMQKTLETKNPVSEEIYEPTLGQTLEISTSPIFDKEGNIQKIVHIIKNTSDKKKLVREIQRDYERTSVINAILHLPTESLQMKELMDIILEHILAISWISVESKGCIFFADNKRGELELISQRGLEPQLLERCNRVKFGHCLCGRAAKTRKVIFSEKLDDLHENRYPGISDHGHYCMPLILKNEILGVINLYVKAGHKFDEYENNFLMFIADAVSSVIERKRSQLAILTAKKELEKKVEELETFNNATVDRELKMIELKKRIEELERKNA